MIGLAKDLNWYEVIILRSKYCYLLSFYLGLIKEGIATEIRTPTHRHTLSTVRPFIDTSGATIVVSIIIPADLLKLIFPVFSDKRDNKPPLFPNKFFNIIIILIVNIIILIFS